MPADEPRHGAADAEQDDRDQRRRRRGQTPENVRADEDGGQCVGEGIEETEHAGGQNRGDLIVDAETELAKATDHPERAGSSGVHRPIVTAAAIVISIRSVAKRTPPAAPL